MVFVPLHESIACAQNHNQPTFTGGVQREELKTMKTFTDNTGNVFSTSHGEPPTCPQPVTTWKDGIPGKGTWNGTQVVNH